MHQSLNAVLHLKGSDASTRQNYHLHDTLAIVTSVSYWLSSRDDVRVPAYHREVARPFFCYLLLETSRHELCFIREQCP